MTIAAPVRFSPSVETIEPDEDQTVSELNASFDEILKTTAEDGGHAIRSVHAKAHGILEGTLTIDDGLPSELAQGMFAVPGEHKVYMRLSTNAGDILDDSISLPRGLAVKVLDVDGERLPGAEGSTQDFVMVNGKTFQAKTPVDFAKSLKLLAKTTDKAEGAKKAFSAVLRGVNTALEAVGIESATVENLGGAPNAHPLGETFYGVTPFRYGDYIAKFSVVPVSPQLQQLNGAIIDIDGRDNAIRETIESDMRGIDGEWEVRVQLCRDLDKMPIEDPTTEWDEAASPFVRVGVIRAKPQDSWDAGLVQAVNEEMRFGVWTGLAAHQPLGGINRARRDTYTHSSDFRAAFNKCPIHEPSAESVAA